MSWKKPQPKLYSRHRSPKKTHKETMPNSDLLIAQLQRRNRIMFGGMLAG